MSARPAARPTFDRSDLKTLALIALCSVTIGLAASTFINNALVPKEWKPTVRTDPATNCQYLEGTWGQLTLRVDSSGKPMCSR